MSRRTDLLQKLINSNKVGKEKEQEQKFLMATAELILSDLIEIAIKGMEKKGAGSLVINLLNDSTTYMSGHEIEFDIHTAEREEDEEVITFLRNLMEEIDSNDWTTNVLITLISDAGTRTFAVEAGRSQESLRALAAEFAG
jgi:DNA-binding phage protein